MEVKTAPRAKKVVQQHPREQQAHVNPKQVILQTQPVPTNDV